MPAAGLRRMPGSRRRVRYNVNVQWHVLSFFFCANNAMCVQISIRMHFRAVQHGHTHDSEVVSNAL